MESAAEQKMQPEWYYSRAPLASGYQGHAQCDVGHIERRYLPIVASVCVGPAGFPGLLRSVPVPRQSAIPWDRWIQRLGQHLLSDDQRHQDLVWREP